MQDGVLPFKATTASFAALLAVFTTIYIVIGLNVMGTWNKWTTALGARVTELMGVTSAAKPRNSTKTPAVTEPEGSVGSTHDVELMEMPRSPSFVPRMRARGPVKDVESGLCV